MCVKMNFVIEGTNNSSRGKDTKENCQNPLGFRKIF